MSDDFSEIYELASDLTDAPELAATYVKKAVQYSATEIKGDWAQGAAVNRLAAYGASIDYDMKYPGGVIEAEIGPNLGRKQGAFGLVEEGGGGVQSAPQHAGRDSLRANEPGFYRGLEFAILDATTKAVEK